MFTRKDQSEMVQERFSSDLCLPVKDLNLEGTTDDIIPRKNIESWSQVRNNYYIDLAKPESGARIFFPARLKGTTLCPGQY